MMSAQLSNAPARAVAEAASSIIGDVAGNGVSVVSTWSERVKLRRDLARLLATDRRLLRDAGFDVAWVAREIEKPFWRA